MDQVFRTAPEGLFCSRTVAGASGPDGNGACPDASGSFNGRPICCNGLKLGKAEWIAANFIAGSLGLSLVAAHGGRASAVRPADQDHLPLRGRRQRRHAVPADRAAASARALDRDHHRREPHRRRRADRHQGGEGRQPRRQHDAGDDRARPCTCCRWWRPSRASIAPRISCRCRCWRGSNSRSRSARRSMPRISSNSWPGSRPIRDKASFGVPSNGTIPHFIGFKAREGCSAFP